MPDAASYDFDVFISYSSKDAVWVRGELVTRLKAAGLRVCIDKASFVPGAPILDEIQRAIDSSKKTLLILTPNYLKSEWTKLESLILQTDDPSNRNLVFIPVYKDECEIPKRIRPFTPVYFTDPAEAETSWRQLLTALGAPPDLPQAAEPERPTWGLVHPYPMPPNFTGRVSERGTLTRWLNEDKEHPLLVLRALGGFGKSALTWHWLTHDVDAAKWPKVLWWSFYEGDASFDQFVVEALGYLYGSKIDAGKLSVRQALDALLVAMHQPGVLLVLDGFERVLRAFSGLSAAYQGDAVKTQDHERDCVSPLAENFLYHLALQPKLSAKVLLTTRLTPRIVEARGGGQLQGCREVELRQMQPEDAVAFFQAQGIRGTHTEIELACEHYGYHPLSLRLLAGLIIGDFQMPGDIAAAKRLDVSGDIIQRQHHVLEQAYESLTPSQQKLLGSIACFRWPVGYDTLKAAADTQGEVASNHPEALEKRPSLDTELRALVTRGLLHHEVKERRFDLHPIVRHYAYDRLAMQDRTAAHTRLRDYFAAVPKVEKITRLEDLAPVIELYHHTVRAGQLDEARTLFRDRLNTPLYYQLGAYPLIIDLLRSLFPGGEDQNSNGQPALPRLKDESDQAWTLTALANAYSLSGQPRRSVPLFEASNDIDEKRGKSGKKGLAIGLGNVATPQLSSGAMRIAETNLRRSIALCREIKDEFWEAVGHRKLGRLLDYCGASAESKTELATALEMFETQKHAQMQGVTWAYRAQRELLLLRQGVSAGSLKTGSSDSSAPLVSAGRALELADEWQEQVGRPNVRDYVRAHWLLGAAHRAAGNHDLAERHLNEALERCRRINLVDLEADILIDLARLHLALGKTEEAQRCAEEALLITERSGYVLQGADAHLELAKLALARGDKAAAKDHAQAAEKLAYCDGPPDYTYKAAYNEAQALLRTLSE